MEKHEESLYALRAADSAPFPSAVLLYIFLDVSRCYVFDFVRTLSWYHTKASHYREVDQYKNAQKNLTKGRLVPVNDVPDELVQLFDTETMKRGSA